MVSFSHGTVDLSGGAIAGTTATIEVLPGDIDLGSGEPLTVAGSSRLVDGAFITGDDTGNRSLKYAAEIKADTWDDMTAAAELLARVVNSSTRTEFRVIPDDPGATPGVIDAFRGRMTPRFDPGWNSALEVFMTLYDVECPALPWVRSSVKTSLTFVQGTTALTTVDACSVTTGWTFSSGTISTVSYLGDTAIRIARSGTVPDYVTATRAGTIAGAYVGIVVGGDVFGGPSWGFVPPTLNGVSPYTYELLPSGYGIWWFTNPGGSSYAFHYLHLAYVDGSPAYAHIGAVVSSASAPTPGLSIADVPGSARAPGTITVTKATTLDNPMVYADPTMLTNGWVPDNAATWPFAPAGRYKVLLQVATSVAGDVFELTVTLGSKTLTRRTRIAAAKTAKWIPFGPFDLTGGRLGMLGAAPTFSLTKNGSAQGILASPGARIFRMADDTAHTWIDADVAGGSVLALDAPSVDVPFGGVWVDNVDVLDQSAAWEVPMLQPGLMSIYAAEDDGTSGITVNVNFYPCSATPYPEP